jgi:hypothetical protein
MEEERSIQSLEHDVTKANNNYIGWKWRRDRKLVPDSLDAQHQLFHALKKAEDDLARAKFEQAVKNDWKRIELVVEEELERIDGLSLLKDPNEQCGLCDEDLSNTLSLVKKHGVGNTQHIISWCCGKKMCKQCYQRTAVKPFKVMEEAINELKQSDGGELMLEDPGNNCRMCNCPRTSSDKKNAAAVEKFAKDGVAW